MRLLIEASGKKCEVPDRLSKSSKEAKESMCPAFYLFFIA